MQETIDQPLTASVETGSLVTAAARAAGGAATWIIADDEGDSKRLYQRLGFREVWIQHVFTRRPG